MIRDEIESVETASPSILEGQTEQLKLIFPQAFSEGKVDFKKLRAALGDVVDTQPERYQRGGHQDRLMSRRRERRREAGERRPG